MPKADPGPTERDFQQQVVELAHLFGWGHMHARSSIGKHGQWVTATNVPWPDLTLFHARLGLIFAELKRRGGSVTGPQQKIHDQLVAAGQVVYVWRPDDWDDIVGVLSGRRPIARPA